MTASQILDWLSSHAGALWPVVSALLIIALRTRSPEEWIAMGERSPRVQGVIRLLRAVGRLTHICICSRRATSCTRSCFAKNRRAHRKQKVVSYPHE